MCNKLYIVYKYLLEQFAEMLYDNISPLNYAWNIKSVAKSFFVLQTIFFLLQHIRSLNI